MIFISPELFVNNSILLQTEYREANKNSDLILDFSINRGEGVTKRHYFSNILGNNEKGDDFEFNLEHVTNDDYLKAHKIKSPIVNTKLSQGSQTSPTPSPSVSVCSGL